MWDGSLLLLFILHAQVCCQRKDVKMFTYIIRISSTDSVKKDILQCRGAGTKLLLASDNAVLQVNKNPLKPAGGISALAP